MSGAFRIRSLILSLVVLFIAAGIVVILAIRSSSQAQQRVAASKQEASIEMIRKRGAKVVRKPSLASDLPSSIASIDLSRATVDAEFIQAIGQFPGIERLTFDEGNWQGEHAALLSKLPKLRYVSFAKSNATDAAVLQLPIGLTHLSLNGTAVTDQSLPHVAKMKGLTSLDIADTAITPEGLRQLEPLQSLKSLWIDESCVNAESAKSLRAMKPQSIEVVGSADLGRPTHEIVSDPNWPGVRCRHPDGYILWEGNTRWSDTFAGVIDAVVSEIGLNPEDAAHLLATLGKRAEFWGRVAIEPPPSPCTFAYGTSTTQGDEISSADEFIRSLRGGTGKDIEAVIRFAKEKFTAKDIPQLLEAIHSIPSTSRFPISFEPFLLIHYGIDHPEVLAELDRLLADETWFIRATTICAFGYGGARPFYAREEWSANEAADDFAVPRLLRIYKNESEVDGTRKIAWLVLAEIAQRRPEHVAEVIPVLAEMPGGKNPFPDETGRCLSQISVPPEIALELAPKLRAVLEDIDRQLEGEPALNSSDVRYPLLLRRQVIFEALSTTARAVPSLAQEVANDYIDRILANQSSGPVAPLLSPATPEANRRAVKELLRHDSEVARYELVLVSKRIRDWRAAVKPNGE